MTFTAVVSYENPSRLGPPLVYMTRSEVTVQRPNKLRVITPGDGPASEFYYDGKTVVAFAPAENLAAVAEAPPTIDATLEAAYHYAAIYFPFYAAYHPPTTVNYYGSSCGNCGGWSTAGPPPRAPLWAWSPVQPLLRPTPPPPRRTPTTLASPPAASTPR